MRVQHEVGHGGHGQKQPGACLWIWRLSVPCFLRNMTPRGGTNTTAESNDHFGSIPPRLIESGPPFSGIWSTVRETLSSIQSSGSIRIGGYWEIRIRTFSLDSLACLSIRDFHQTLGRESPFKIRPMGRVSSRSSWFNLRRFSSPTDTSKARGVWGHRSLLVTRTSFLLRAC